MKCSVCERLLVELDCSQNSFQLVESGNRQEVTREKNVVQGGKLSLIKRSKTRQKESTARMRRRFSALSLFCRFLQFVHGCISQSAVSQLFRQFCACDHNKMATRNQVVLILKEAIAKIEDDDKGSHQQQSTLSSISESFSEAVERDLK